MSYVSRKEIWAAYYDCIKRKRNTDNAINFEINDNIFIENLYKELNTMTYQIGKSIVFTLWDNDKKCAHREVFAADFKDRIVHHLIINRIVSAIEKYDLIDDNYACRIGKGTLYGAKRCKTYIEECYNSGKQYWILKGDFKNFFNRLNKEYMYNRLEIFLRQYINDKNMKWNLWILKMIIMHCPQNKGNYIRKQPKRFWKGLPEYKSLFNQDDNHGIAVGNLTSQIFANFYLSGFDHYVTNILGYKYYGRYVDDFYIISDDKEKLKEDYKNICEYANKIDLTINTNKKYLQPIEHNVNFIGYMIYPDKMYLRKSTIKKLRNKLYKYNKEIESIMSLGKYPTYEYIEKFMCSWNSYFGMMKHTDNNILRGILEKYNYVKILINSFFDIDRDGLIRYNKETKTVIKLKKMYGDKVGKTLYIKKFRKA